MSVDFKETKTPSINKNASEFADQKLLHICEVCGKWELLTPNEGFQKGWDAAPYMYPFKVISPRTCGNCGIDETVWFEIAVKNKTFEDLSEKQKETVKRIYGEPESILPK